MIWFFLAVFVVFPATVILVKAVNGTLRGDVEDLKQEFATLRKNEMARREEAARFLERHWDVKHWVALFLVFFLGISFALILVVLSKEWALSIKELRFIFFLSPLLIIFVTAKARKRNWLGEKPTSYLQTFASGFVIIGVFHATYGVRLVEKFGA